MKGKLHKKDNNWVVTIEELGDLPLHPDLIKEFKDWELMFDNIEARILAQPYADFEIIDGCARLTYKTE